MKLSVLYVIVILLLYGCESITKPWNEKTPEEKAVTIGVGVMVGGAIYAALDSDGSNKTTSWKVQKVGTHPGPYKALAVAIQDDGSILSAQSNVYRGAYKTVLYRNNVALQTFNNCETLTDPVQHNGWTYFASEHCPAIKVRGSKVVTLPVGGANKWAITTGLINGQPVGFYTDGPYNGSFIKPSVAFNLNTGKQVWKSSGPALARAWDNSTGCGTFGWNGGRETIQCLDGRKMPSKRLTAAGGEFGGDIRYGYQAPHGPANNNVYKLGGVTKYTIPSLTVMDSYNDGNTIITCGVEPASVAINGKVIWTGKGGQGPRSFGIACTVRDNTAAWVVTENGVVALYKAKKQ